MQNIWLALSLFIAKARPTHMHVGSAGGTAIVERSRHLNAICFIEKPLSIKGFRISAKEKKNIIIIIPTKTRESLYKLWRTFLGNNISLTKSPFSVWNPVFTTRPRHFSSF